jgi:hypothetical protein
MNSTDEHGPAQWRKSSASQNDDCVECMVDQDVVLVRDSKNSAGPMLAVTRADWSSFLARVRN